MTLLLAAGIVGGPISAIIIAILQVFIAWIIDEPPISCGRRRDRSENC